MIGNLIIEDTRNSPLAVDALKIPREQAGLLVVDDTYVEVKTVLEDGLELSIFPPLAGGVRG